MKLTKQQITYIENRLIQNGVKYWDIRIELLDHVVTDVEHQLKKQEDFKKAVHNSFISLGWNGSFDDVVLVRLKGINKIVRKQYFKQVKNLFTKITTLVTILIFFLCYWFVYQNLSTNVFKKVSIFFLITPVALSVSQYFYITFKKEKSGMLLYGSFYVFFSFLVVNGYIQFTNPKVGYIEVSKETFKFIIFMATIVNSVFTYAGIKVYIQTLKKSKKLYQKVFTL